MKFPRSQPATGSKPQRVFITGASSGIGAALARYYSSHRAIVGIAARRSEHLQIMAAELGGRATVYGLDVRDSRALKQAAKDFMQAYGTPDIVIANAGVSHGTLTEHQEDIPAFQAIMDINVMGMVNTFQPFIAAMRRDGHGQFVGIASVAGIRGLPGAGAYSASKAAAISYLESLRVEMAEYGIAVTTIAPGYIRTPMTDVNAYKMPFLMDADIAAAKFADAIARKRHFVVIPWQMAVVARLLRLLPSFLWDTIARRAPRKTRLEQ